MGDISLAGRDVDLLRRQPATVEARVVHEDRPDRQGSSATPTSPDGPVTVRVEELPTQFHHDLRTEMQIHRMGLFS
jgi:hypothetical protein